MRGAAFAFAALAIAACAADADGTSSSESDVTGIERPQDLAPDESVLMLFGTNDVHGSFDRFGQLGGYVDAARAHVRASYGDRGALVVLDAGDMTQGTLLSNYSEGLVAVRAMNAIGYAAAVAGNHGFDFGPEGWQTDQCDPTQASCDPLAALRKSVQSAAFPFLGANVWRRADGAHVDFLPPYVLVPFQGRAVAVIGLENHYTDRTTIPENVATLRFGDGVTELRDTVEQLFTSGKADVFVLVMHEGDGDAPEMKTFLESLPKRSDGRPLVDAAIAGHSHRINDDVAGGIPYIQSGANGELFGIVEIVAKKDASSGRLVVEAERTRKHAAIPIAGAPTSFLTEPVKVRDDVAAIVRAAEDEVRPLATEHLATSDAPVSRDGGRLADSEIGNLVTNAMLRATGAEIAMINGGDVRDDLPAGDILFQDLFRALPKNLGLVTVTTMPTSRVVDDVKLSVKSCGRRGAMQIAGAKVLFRRDCTRAVDGEDPQAELVAIVLASGEVLAHGDVASRPTVKIATTDFVMSGGAGYGAFVGVSATAPATPLRDAVVDDMKRQGRLDAAAFARGRYVDCSASASIPGCD